MLLRPEQQEQQQPQQGGHPSIAGRKDAGNKDIRELPSIVSHYVYLLYLFSVAKNTRHMISITSQVVENKTKCQMISIYVATTSALWHLSK